jgi:hypothetical protein
MLSQNQVHALVQPLEVVQTINRDSLVPGDPRRTTQALF